MQAQARHRGKSASLNSFGPGAQVLFHALLALFSLLCIVPFLFVIIISFTSEDSIRQIGYSFVPLSWGTQAYKYVFELGIPLAELLQLVPYYRDRHGAERGHVRAVRLPRLFRKDFKFRGFLNFLSFFTMIFGGGLVPAFVICKSVLGLSDNYAALIVPLLFSPFNIIVMRTFFQTSVPMELIEAATIDGSGEYEYPAADHRPRGEARHRYHCAAERAGVLERMVPVPALPEQEHGHHASAIPADADAAQRGFPCEGQLHDGRGRRRRLPWSCPTQSLKMALVVFIVIPIACAYPFFQRYVVAGLTIGSVKG